MTDIKLVMAILPVGKLYDPIFTEAIFPAVSDLSARVTRLEPEFASENKLGAICRELESADLAIIDISARNPHAMYLAGYAHGTGRKLLLLSQHGEDFPFDRTKHTAIIYGNDLQFLKRELINHLKGEPVTSPDVPTADSAEARAKFQSIFGDIMAQHGHEHRGPIYMENPTTFVLLNQDMELPLVQDLARRGRELNIRLKLM